MTWIKPFPDSTITGHFGKIRTFKGAPTNPHRGTDWAPKANTVIPNITAGKVALIQFSKVLGWVCVIEADDSPWFVGYCHLSCAKHGINCKGPDDKCKTPFTSTKVGDTKDLREPVGRVGNTGKSTGPHLHATLSKTVRGVFSGQVFDLFKHIEAQSSKPEPAKPTPAAEKIIYACPHCKKELK